MPAVNGVGWKHREGQGCCIHLCEDTDKVVSTEALSKLDSFCVKCRLLIVGHGARVQKGPWRLGCHRLTYLDIVFDQVYGMSQAALRTLHQIGLSHGAIERELSLSTSSRI